MSWETITEKILSKVQEVSLLEQNGSIASEPLINTLRKDIIRTPNLLKEIIGEHFDSLNEDTILNLWQEKNSLLSMPKDFNIISKVDCIRLLLTSKLVQELSYEAREYSLQEHEDSDTQIEECGASSI